MSAEGPTTAIPDGTREGVDVPTRSARAPAASVAKTTDAAPGTASRTFAHA